MSQYDKKIQILIKYGDVTKANKKYHNSNWARNADHVYRISITGNCAP